MAAGKSRYWLKRHKITIAITVAWNGYWFRELLIFFVSQLYVFTVFIRIRVFALPSLYRTSFDTSTRHESSPLNRWSLLVWVRKKLNSSSGCCVLNRMSPSASIVRTSQTCRRFGASLCFRTCHVDVMPVAISPQLWSYFRPMLHIIYQSFLVILVYVGPLSGNFTQTVIADNATVVLQVTTNHKPAVHKDVQADSL